jgi:hypothetical protein
VAGRARGSLRHATGQNGHFAHKNAVLIGIGQHTISHDKLLSTTSSTTAPFTVRMPVSARLKMAACATRGETRLRIAKPLSFDLI